MSKRIKKERTSKRNLSIKYVIIGGGIAAVSCLRELTSLVSIDDDIMLVTSSSTLKEVQKIL